MSVNLKLLESIADGWLQKEKKVSQRLVLCAGTGCIANGALKVHAALLEAAQKHHVKIEITLQQEEPPAEGSLHLSKSGCQGFCQQGPLLTIEPDGILYTHVKPHHAEAIIQKTILQKEIIEELLYKDPSTGKPCKGQHEIPFYKLQTRFVLKECGLIDPEDLGEYISKGGYKATVECYTQKTDEEVCRFILESGLRGRGGGGFPTGRKWELTRIQKSDKKYVICNGDEGDPGAFMDRSVMEGNPHAVIEGMLIAAYGIGADEGYVYVRTEYPLAVSRMRRAVADAQKLGLLGKNLFGTNKNFTLHVMEGAGAFVCGEETALMASVEGHRGMPNPKPPFPAQSGLWKKPTLINNVETLATVPLIFKIGVQEYRKMGTQESPGTKTFALTGHVANTGLVEVPFGTTLRKIVMDIGGGVTDDAGNVDNSLFKAVQIGGPSGGCLVDKHLELTLDFESLAKEGSMIGSGGLVVMNSKTCMAQMATFFMNFTQNESCGKCVPCREGTKQMLHILHKIEDGTATESDLKNLLNLAVVIKDASLCGLGKTAPNPVLSMMKYFEKEMKEHALDKYCRTSRCIALLKPEIDPEKCIGCTLCSKKCPVNAISGSLKKPHTIDAEKCIKCGVCAQVCKFKAVKGFAV